MKNVEIIELDSHQNPEIYQKIAELFLEMYQYLDKKGLNMPLAENGHQIWIDSIKNMLGKNYCIFAAIHKSNIIGFAAGNIRLAPAYLGNKKTGYISNVFVFEEHRQSNLGNQLVDRLEQWLKSKKVDFIELEVLYQNHGAIQFWNKLDYQKDYIKMIKNG